MKISMIAAMAKNRIIGKDNQMPWHLPADFAWFKRCTMGKPIIMGRKTFESIGRPLPGRQNIVISRDPSIFFQGVSMATSIESALSMVKTVPEVMIIGGGSIYDAYLDKAERLYLTHIELDVDGDTQFPCWGDGWKEISSEEYRADDNNQHNMTFQVIERVSK